MRVEDIVIIGAGPCGLSAAAELQDRGFDPLLIEKENVANSIYLYPTNMQFFSTPELLEIAGVPFVTPNPKPYRHEALVYYRTVAERRNFRIRRYEKVTAVVRKENGFLIRSETKAGEQRETESRAVVVATGYFDHPVRLGVPGEDLPHVSHFFREAHPYAGTRVVVVGGSNSAADAALELERVGANVTVVYRRAEMSSNIKPWIRPLFESSVRKGNIALRLETHVVAIEPDRVTVRGPTGATEDIPCDFVLAMTGFRPDRSFLRAMGVEAPADDQPPVYNPETMETNVPGLYLAGVVASGANANEIFIETGRFHGRKIAEHFARKMRRQA